MLAMPLHSGGQAGIDTRKGAGMDQLKELPREAQVTLGCLVLFVIISFLDWQQVSVGPYSAGRNLWHGIGIITALLADGYLGWEIARALKYSRDLGPVNPPQTSAAFALALIVFTVITFLDWSDFRHWPQWVGLLLAIVITVVAFKRAKDEGVEIPKMPQGSSAGGGTAAAAAPAAAPAAEPAPATDPAPPSDPPPPAAEGEPEAQA
jgi:hypothetical protein